MMSQCWEVNVLNHVMGQNAIMSDKAQTTRNKIMGIYTTDKEINVFIDTPGIHKPKTALETSWWSRPMQSLREVDTVLFMVPADEPRGKGDVHDHLSASRLLCRLFWWSTRSTRCTLTNSGANR